MGLFNFGKKKTTTSSCCAGTCEPPVKEEKILNEKGEEMAMCECGSMCSVADIEAKKAAKNAGASVKVLGSGCKKCNDLEAATVEALTQLNMDSTIDHVTDFSEIATYGVMTTPALVVDGKVLSTGKVLKVAEVVTLLEKARN